MGEMRTVESLQDGDFIAFEFSDGLDRPDIWVTDITTVEEDQVLVHFVYGYKSEAEWIPKDKIIAIGNPEGQHRIPHWGGKFDIILPNHPLLNK